MAPTYNHFFEDIETVKQIAIVPALLEIICRSTGMRFAAIARVTEDRWIACSVKDELGFGLKPGGELKVETTLCNEIRAHREPIIIDNVAEDEKYAHHHTPRIYGIQSYISFPIVLKTGELFGTLCAIDPKPAYLNNPRIIGIFSLFCELLSFHLQNLALVEKGELDLHIANYNLLEAFPGFFPDNFTLSPPNSPDPRYISLFRLSAHSKYNSATAYKIR
jgi:GAF domain-containing protein